MLTLKQDALQYIKDIEDTLALKQGELRDTKLDLDDAQSRRREIQEKLNKATSLYSAAAATLDRNSYMQVLIDGDGMIFHADLIRQGVEGGKQAAGLLRNAVLGPCSEIPDEIEVIANVYCNLQGLSNASK